MPEYKVYMFLDDDSKIEDIKAASEADARTIAIHKYPKADITHVDLIEDVVVVRTEKSPPSMVWMRWSKVLGRYVTCLESDRDALSYKLVK